MKSIDNFFLPYCFSSTLDVFLPSRNFLRNTRGVVTCVFSLAGQMAEGGGNLIFFPVSLSFATRAAVMLKRSSKVDEQKCKNLLPSTSTDSQNKSHLSYFQWFVLLYLRPNYILNFFIRNFLIQIRKTLQMGRLCNSQILYFGNVFTRQFFT